MKTYQVNVNGNSYNVTVKNISGNTAMVDVDGWEFEVSIGGNSVPQMAAISPSQQVQTGSGPQDSSKGSRKRSTALGAGVKQKGPAVSGKGVVMAHLPGLILDILVKPGDRVKAGDVICKMEAMKMENDVRAHIDGKIREIMIEVQQNVLENQPLMVIE